MHELSLMADLMKTLNAVAREHGAARIAVVRVHIGALAHISAGHFREHFEQAARGTPAEGARLEVTEGNDPFAPQAQDIVLESVDVVAEGEDVKT